VIKEQIKEQMKILHDKKKIAQLGLEQGVTENTVAAVAASN